MPAMQLRASARPARCCVRPAVRAHASRLSSAQPCMLRSKSVYRVVAASQAAPQLSTDAVQETAASSLVKFAATCGVAMAVALASCNPASAADTGGRVGGSSFNARRQAYNSQTTSSRTTTVSHTTVVVSQPAPMFGFMPIGFMPMGIGFGYHSPASTILSLLALVLLLFIIVQIFSMIWGNNQQEEEYYESDPPATVVKLQLGLLGLAKNVRAELDSLALRADTSSSEGLHFILQETILALMRHPDYFVYASASADVVYSDDEAERMFNSLSLSERAKVKQETLTNVGGYTTASFSGAGNNGVNELILVTIMLAAEGQIALPAIRSAADAREALSKLGGLPSSAIMGVELLWSPQAPGDTLTQTQLLADYPQLVPV